MIYLRQKTEPATESPPGKIAIPMKKTLHHGNNSICSPKYLTPPETICPPPPPNNLNLPGKFYCHLSNYLNHSRLQPSQPNYSNYKPLYEKMPTFPDNFQPLQTREAM